MCRLIAGLLLALSVGVASAAPPPVSAVAYSTDGKLLAVGSRGVVWLIDEKGELVVDLPSQSQRVTALAFSKDVLAVASGEPGKSGTVKLYQTKDFAKAPITVEAHKDIIYTMTFNPDGSTLATAGYDRIVKLWDISKPTAAARELKDHSDTIHALAFRNGGKQLVSVAADRSVKVWDVAKGTRLYSLGDSTDWLYALAISPDGTKIVAGGVDRSLRTWDVEAESAKLNKAAFAHSAAILYTAFSPDDKLIYSVGEDKIIKVWDAKSLTETLTFKALPASPLAAVLSPDGKRLAVALFDGSVQVLDTKTGSLLLSPLPLKPKPPVLIALEPSALLRGTTTKLTLKGTRLADVLALKASRADVLVKYDAKSAKGDSATVELTIPASASPGNFTLIGTSQAGDSNSLQLVVDAFAQVPEPAKTESARQSDLVPLPATVVGKLDRTGEVDYVSFRAKAGDEIGVQLVGPVGVKNFDPVLTLTNDKGQVLQESKSSLLGFNVPADGVYAIGVADAEFRGSATSTYRLNIGPLPIITSVYPLAVSRGSTTKVLLNGVNLGNAKARMVAITVPADAQPGSKVPLPLGELSSKNPAGAAQVFVSVQGTSPTQEISVPGSSNGWIRKPNGAEEVSFTAKKGQRLIVEVEAARFGSLLDSTIEIVDAQGKVVPRATLRSVAQTFLTFRDHDCITPGIRLETWNELKIGDYLYCGTELMRIQAMPKNPDDDCQFVQVGGKREAYMGTTPTHHAQNAPMYKIEMHPPGATFPPNGLPVMRLEYRNDDGGDGFGKDSMLDFVAPMDGKYTVRIRDSRGFSGEQFGYRLTVRPPQPSFTLSINPMNPAVWKNGGVPITVTAKRIDGFTGPIQVEFANVLAPLSLPKIVIDAEQNTAAVTLFLAGEAIQNPSVITAKATAKIDGIVISREVSLGTPTVRDGGDLVTTVGSSELVIKPGQESKFVVKIERKGDFKGRVPLEVRGLPHGVRVMNIGLSGILVLPEQTEREVVIFAEAWVEPMELPIVVSSRSERRGTEHAAKSVLLRVTK